MSEGILNLVKEALWVSILSSLPAILVSLIIGVMVAIFSATTQIQEQTLSFAPKMLGVYLVLFFMASFIAGTIINFTQKCFSFSLWNHI